MDHAAFSAFYNRCFDRIYRYVYFRVGGNKALAEDLVSEIFLKALEHFKDYDPKISQSAWIYQIAHNHLANYYRDKKQQVPLEDAVLGYFHRDGWQTFGHTADELQLRGLLEKLTSDERRLVTMKYIEGYNYEDMAGILGRTPAALKVGTHRAMKKLKTIWQDS